MSRNVEEEQGESSEARVENTVWLTLRDASSTSPALIALLNNTAILSNQISKLTEMVLDMKVGPRSRRSSDGSSRVSSDGSSRRSSNSRAADDGDSEPDEDTVAVKSFVDNDDFFTIFESFIQNSRQQPNVKQGVNTRANGEKFREAAQDQLKTTWDPVTLVYTETPQDEILARLVPLNDDQILQLYNRLSKRLTKTPTADEIAERAHDLETMRNEFNTRLLEQAKKDLNNADDGDDAAALADPDNLDQSFPQDNEEIPEPDADTQFADQVESGQAVETFPDEIADIPGGVSALDYGAAAKAAMEVWLSVGTDQYVLGTKLELQSVCQLCVDDDTVDYRAKSKLWQSHHLQRHQDSDVHSRFKQFSHRAQRFARDNGLDGVVCELCAEIMPDDLTLPTYATGSTLARHIRDSSQHKLVAIEADCNWWKDGSFDA
ncbi:hypothetical protein ACHAQD_003729 [Fusarium lateritium]